jgi:hypothetical protein
MTPIRLIATVCAAQVLTQVGAYALPAILPLLIHAWTLSNAAGGGQGPRPAGLLILRPRALAGDREVLPGEPSTASS